MHDFNEKKSFLLEFFFEIKENNKEEQNFSPNGVFGGWII